MWSRRGNRLAKRQRSTKYLFKNNSVIWSKLPSPPPLSRVRERGVVRRQVLIAVIQDRPPERQGGEEYSAGIKG